MQDVSNEWILNQNSTVQSQGFVEMVLIGGNTVEIPVSYTATVQQTRLIFIFNVESYTTEDSAALHIKWASTDEMPSPLYREFDFTDRVEFSDNESEIYVEKGATEIWLFGYATVWLPYIKSNGNPLSAEVITHYTPIDTSDLKSFSHERSFDPISLNLPVNDISIELYNYDNQYLELYKTYDSLNYMIRVKYGYHLSSGDEVIPGGLFYVSDISLSDKIITITAESALIKLDFENDCNIVDICQDGELTVTTSEGTIFEKVYTTYTDPCFKIEDNLDSISPPERVIKPKNIFDFINNKSGISVVYDDALTDEAYSSPVWWNGLSNVRDLSQVFANYIGAKFYISRDNEAVFRASSFSGLAQPIVLLNMMDSPEYVYTSSVSEFAITYKELSLGGNTDDDVQVTALYFDDLLQDTDSGTYHRTMAGDLQGKRVRGVRKINSNNGKLKDGEVEGYKGIAVCQHGVDVYADGKLESGSKYNFAIVLYPETEQTVTISKSTNGQTCDISNPLGKPNDDVLDRAAKYYSNRDLYTFYLRGDPARDVGDYVRVSLTDDSDSSTYKTGLVLSSTLTFDGSFKEEVEVRIIEEAFDTESASALDTIFLDTETVSALLSQGIRYVWDADEDKLYYVATMACIGELSDIGTSVVRVISSSGNSTVDVSKYTIKSDGEVVTELPVNTDITREDGYFTTDFAYRFDGTPVGVANTHSELSAALHAALSHFTYEEIMTTHII